MARKFRRPGSAIRRGFGDFPYHRTNVTIEVYPPSFDATVVYLWQNVNHLVDLLARAFSVKEITLICKPFRASNWISNGQGIATLNLFDWRYPRCKENVAKFELERGVYDHEAVLLPLCRLRNVQAIELIPAWDASSDEALGLDNRLHRFVSLYLPKTLRDDLSQEQRVIAEERVDLLLRFISQQPLSSCFVRSSNRKGPLALVCQEVVPALERIQGTRRSDGSGYRTEVW
ncbi:hypothetical protein BJY00DRAFT_147870 [Aspergillus carlsbadensis]|nr:hypothetical protein BJY00DRAFT_147870 [Aspergillus carlsbadensis]